VVPVKRLGWRGLLLLVTGLLLAILPAISFAHDLFTSTYTEGGVKIRIDGIDLQFDPAPYIAPPGRTMVPMRGIFESLGAQVEWLAESQTILAHRGNREVRLQIGSTMAYVDGVGRPMDVAPAIQQDRTYVPLRFVAEALNASVNWDPREHKASINSSATQLSKLDLVAGTKLHYRLTMVQLALPRQLTMQIEQRAEFPGSALIKVYDPAQPELALRFDRTQLASSTKLLPTNLAIDGSETAPWLSQALFHTLKKEGKVESATLGGLAVQAQEPGKLSLEERTTFVLTLDGERVALPALILLTPNGDRLWVLDDPFNPLILKVEAVGEPIQGAPATYGLQLELVEQGQ
jgi:hypothetical protein